MRWLDTLTPGLTASDVMAALRGAGIEAKLDEDDDELEFDSDDWHYSIDFDPASKRVRSRGAWRTLPHEDGLQLVASALRDERDVTVSVTDRASDTRLKIGWVTPTRHLVLSFADDDHPAHLRCDTREGEPAPDREAVTVERYRAQLDDIARLLATTPAATGDRGTAVARWLAHHERRHALLARAVTIAEQTAPGARVFRSALSELAEDVAQLAEHERRFTGEDDWRSALAIVERSAIAYNDLDRFGWQLDLAAEGAAGPDDPERRAVVLVEGPFAYGVHRVARTTHELHAVRAEWPTGKVVTRWKRGPCIALLGETKVTLSSMNGDVERIATLLACARAAR